MIPMEFSVEGKTAVVTGGGRGIGRAIALTLAEAGADIVVAARTMEQIEETAAEVEKIGRVALAIPTDVTREEQVKATVQKALSQFGKIDILVNDAGIDSPMKPVVYLPGYEFLGRELAGENAEKQLSPEEWRTVIDTNLTGAFLFAQAVGPHMLQRRQGKVINISSNSAELGTPYNSPYCASKAGLSVFTRCLATEWAPFNVQVNAIGPGATKTKMLAQFIEDPKMRQVIFDQIPAGRLAEPRDIALLALYLASSASDFMIGQTIYLDGGQLGRGLGL